MIDQLKDIVDKTIADVNLEHVKVEEVVKDLVENSRFFAFRILVASRILEKTLLAQEQPPQDPPA
jgi:hypothetical protein